MTHDEIISMAQQVAKEFDYLWCNNIPELERFAELVAAREREELLDLVDSYAKDNADLKAAIRARAEKETK